MEHREFSDEQVAQALAVLKANGGNAKRTAAQLGIARTTLRQWAGRAKSSTARPKHVEPALQTAVDEKFAERLDAAFLMVTDPELIRAKLDKASLRDLLISGDIATRGRALLRGQATSRTESVRVSLVAPDVLRSDRLRVIEGGRKSA